MRDKVLKKTETKAKKDGKNNKNNETEEDGFIRDKNGEILCCIPMVPCNKKGHPLPESLEDGGVKLCCTNNCAYSKHLVHPECFESLEQGLITMLSNQKTGKKGLIKAWLESQNEVNLWSKRGLEFIQKTVRCPCGKGQMYRDEDSWIKRQQLFDPLCDKKDKKFKLKANLPALTVAVKKGAAPPPDFHELDTHYISSHSPPPSKKIDDKYGPPPETKARKPSIDDTVVSKPPLAKKISVEFASIKPSIAKPVEKPVKKVPVEYAPIEPTDFPKLVEDAPKLRQDIHPTSILSQYMEPKTASYTAEVKSKVSTMADIVKPKPLELAQEKLLNQWKQPPNIKATTDTTQRETEPCKSVESKTKMEHTLEPKIQNLITMNDTVQSSKIQKFMNDIEQFQTERSKKETATPERAISPTNTTSSDASSSLKSYHSFSNQRVNVAVQTDETSFPQTFNAAPISQRLDSVNYDSGNQSSLCSPAFALSNRRPSSNSNYSANVRLNDTRHREFSYEPNIRKSSDRSSTLGNEYYNEEDLSPKVSFLFKNQSFAVEVCHNGEKGKLKNSNGYIWTPMYFSMTEGGPHIGERAQNDYQEFPSFVIYDIMKVIGKRWDQINPSQQWGFQLVPADETIGFDIDTSSKKRQTFPQELVLAMFLKTMKSCADSHFGTAIKEIYISTDFFLTESQKTIFEKAAAKLNLKIVTYTLIDTQ